MATTPAPAAAAPAARPDWRALARRTWRTRFTGQSALLAFLVIVSVPIILPYFWMVVIAFTARTGGVGSDVLWTACAAIVPAVLVYSLVHMSVASRGLRLATGIVLLAIAGMLLAGL